MLARRERRRREEPWEDRRWGLKFLCNEWSPLNFIFEGFGAAEEVLHNFNPICTAALELRVLHEVLELGCLGRKLVRVDGVQL
jgi:hypothetical protein